MNSIKSEKLEKGTWSEIQEPLASFETTTFNAAIFLGGNHYFFGHEFGMNPKQDSIHKLHEKTWTWSYLGQMNSRGRTGYSIIRLAERFMVVGGMSSPARNEVCSLESGILNCTEFVSELNNYFHYPILHVVDDDYKNCS